MMKAEEIVHAVRCLRLLSAGVELLCLQHKCSVLILDCNATMLRASLGWGLGKNVGGSTAADMLCSHMGSF